MYSSMNIPMHIPMHLHSTEASRMETRNTDSRASRQDGQRAAKTKKSKPQRSRTTIGGAMQRKITPTVSAVCPA